MKKYLVGTALGHSLLGLSHFKSLKSLRTQNPERAAMVANAVLADRLVTRLCPSGGTFIDVGAHIGSIFSTVHRLDSSVRIVAVEADPSKAENLAARFDYITLHACAVGDSEGQITFYIDPDATGYNSLVKREDGTQIEISVEIRKLDDLLKDETPDVIKIDIEGAELGALRGGAQVIAVHRPTIMFESTETGTNALGYSPDLLWNWLHDMGYGVFTPDRLAHDAPPLDLTSFLDAHAYPMRTLNYFAVHDSKRTDIRDRARGILGIKVGA
ncbi:FkbM family methyltransferase [Sulfitobacter sp. HNIBRBA3233]|uniref:FkbM family methyltransferase n=1 Tax=Sulfitobacter marinivivus TaxID=3158558 RepID=UPI0032DFA2AA